MVALGQVTILGPSSDSNVCVCAYVCLCLCVYVSICACICVYVVCVYICSYMSLCIYARMYVYICVRLCTYICMCVTYVYVHACLCVCVYIHVCICVSAEGVILCERSGQASCPVKWKTGWTDVGTLFTCLSCRMLILLLFCVPGSKQEDRACAARLGLHVSSPMRP